MGYTPSVHLRLANNSTLALDRPAIVGILNVTPDSFSDGGQFIDVNAAVAHGVAMAKDGAAVIDVGGESTRPGAQPVDAAEQRRRVVPVIERLQRELDAVAGQGSARPLISIDTTLPEVADAALGAGAAIINDISAGLGWGREAETGMLALAAQRGVPVVLMHMRGAPPTMQQAPAYRDVVSEVLAFLAERVQAAQGAGVANDRIVIDPGIGFGKTAEHNVALLRALGRFVATGYPVMLGASRKKFLATLAGPPASDEALVGATCATTALGVHQGVQLFRVHDVKANRAAAEVAYGLSRTGGVDGESGQH